MNIYDKSKSVKTKSRLILIALNRDVTSTILSIFFCKGQNDLELTDLGVGKHA